MSIPDRAVPVFFGNRCGQWQQSSPPFAFINILSFQTPIHLRSDTIDVLVNSLSALVCGEAKNDDFPQTALVMALRLAKVQVRSGSRTRAFALHGGA